MSLLIGEIEYAVRFQIPGETEQIKAVGGREDAADLIHDMWLRHGITGERVGRQVGPWEEM